MSSAKFASITSSLLARKGEARPWAQQDADISAPPLVWRNEARPVVAAPPPPPPAKDRSCSVRMSAHDYERLGILAVKSNSTRQQLLKDALAHFLASKAQDYACACLGACDRSCSSAG
ncbi:MAG TPA: hypothetical protein VHY57_00465 [Rhizomicrobium sp.]|nr:hypothetical protein [Rhizomicrobium sp.]